MTSFEDVECGPSGGSHWWTAQRNTKTALLPRGKDSGNLEEAETSMVVSGLVSVNLS